MYSHTILVYSLLPFSIPCRIPRIVPLHSRGPIRSDILCSVWRPTIHSVPDGNWQASETDGPVGLLSQRNRTEFQSDSLSNLFLCLGLRDQHLHPCPIPHTVTSRGLGLHGCLLFHLHDTDHHWNGRQSAWVETSE